MMDEVTLTKDQAILCSATIIEGSNRLSARRSPSVAAVRTAIADLCLRVRFHLAFFLFSDFSGSVGPLSQNPPTLLADVLIVPATRSRSLKATKPVLG